jgi:hypothetical protein
VGSALGEGCGALSTLSPPWQVFLGGAVAEQRSVLPPTSGSQTVSRELPKMMNAADSEPAQPKAKGLLASLFNRKDRR